jgi:hypothetical protein
LTKWYLFSNSFLIGAALTLVLMCLGVALVVPVKDRWHKRYFITFFGYLTLYCCCCVVEAVLCLYSNTAVVLEITWFIESVLASLLMPMLTIYLLHCCGESWRHSRLFYATAALWCIFLILLILNLFNHRFYFVASNKQPGYGPWYPLMMSSLVLIMVLNLISLVRRRTRLPKQAFFSCLAGILPMTITMCIHMFVPVFQLFGIGIAICALSMFGIILSYQVEQYMLHQREIANQRASIMVLQMRPHFIYNTMMSIYYLCDLDSKKAQQVTLDFTSYLRKNFTAIASQETIPFSEELEHTRAYLAVEQAQFEENLFVDFDTPHTRFFLPPLTLQPIVENAVKHGMDPDSDPLRISIRTLESDSGSVIIVENNGLNFSPEENNEPHIALANIRERLETMCRGKMSILPRAGGGTSVRIWIPEQRSH